MNYTEKNKLLDKISVIGIMAIFVEFFLYAVNICYTDNVIEWGSKMPGILNVTGVIFLIISVVLYILAYKKSKMSRAVYATEFLILALMCPFLTYWYTRSVAPLNTIDPKVLWVVVLVYYVMRVVYVWVKSYMNSSSKQLKKKKN